MDVRFEVAGPAAPDLLRDLDSWLSREPGLTGRIRPIEKGPEPGQLGPTLEAIQLAVSSVSAAAAAANLFVGWLQFRKPGVTLKVVIDRSGSVVSAVAGESEESPEDLKKRLLEEFTRALEQERQNRPGGDGSSGDGSGGGSGSGAG
jgi:hypothetical protein